MKAEIAKLWSAALRSSDYTQTTGVLRRDRASAGDPAGFCCLGVLCNLHAQAHPEIAARQLDPKVYLGEEEMLPPAVAEWAGMRDPRGAYTDEYHDPRECHADLVDANDEGEDFRYIAGVIDEFWEEL